MPNSIFTTVVGVLFFLFLMAKAYLGNELIVHDIDLGIASRALLLWRRRSLYDSGTTI